MSSNLQLRRCIFTGRDICRPSHVILGLYCNKHMSKIHPAERAQYSLREVWLREQEMIGQVILSWAVQRPDMKWRFDLDSNIHLDNYLAVIMPFSVITHDFPFFSTTRLVMTT